MQGILGKNGVKTASYTKNLPDRERKLQKYRRKRALRRAAFVEKVDRQVVFERDNWVCHVCGEPVDQALSGRDPMGPTVDHVIPLSRGGKDCYDNVALAHLSCNSRKWIRLEAGDHAYGQ